MRRASRVQAFSWVLAQVAPCLLTHTNQCFPQHKHCSSYDVYLPKVREKDCISFAVQNVSVYLATYDLKSKSAQFRLISPLSKFCYYACHHLLSHFIIRLIHVWLFISRCHHPNRIRYLICVTRFCN